jgi:hypothetical protein
MTPEERERMNCLCRRIQDEKNPEQFSELVRELNELLAQKQHRIDSDSRTKLGK